MSNMSHYILYNLNKLKLQDVIFESATILVVVALCESSIYLYNCTSITGVSKDKTNAEKERERYACTFKAALFLSRAYACMHLL